MARFFNILFIVFSVFFAGVAKAQEQHGDVVVHIDPRLGKLLKKNLAPAKVSPVGRERVMARAAEKERPIASVTPVVEKSHPAAPAPVVKPVATTPAPVEKSHPVASVSPVKPAVMPVTTPIQNNHPVTPFVSIKVASVSATPIADKNRVVAKTLPFTSTAPVKPAPAAPPPAKYITEKLTTTEKSRVLYSGKGFRVQIYNGPDRGKAVETKMEFMRRYPDVRTYLTYVAPSFRVKVGNYRNRSDAEGMYREAKSMYSPCMIVPDVIIVSTY